MSSPLLSIDGAPEGDDSIAKFVISEWKIQYSFGVGDKKARERNSDQA